MAYICIVRYSKLHTYVRHVSCLKRQPSYIKCENQYHNASDISAIYHKSYCHIMHQKQYEICIKYYTCVSRICIIYCIQHIMRQRHTNISNIIHCVSNITCQVSNYICVKYQTSDFVHAHSLYLHTDIHNFIHYITCIYMLHILRV